MADFVTDKHSFIDMNSLVLTPEDRAKLTASGAIVAVDYELKQAHARRMWQAAIRKARAAYVELQHAEKAYIEVMQKTGAGFRVSALPVKDPYSSAT